MTGTNESPTLRSANNRWGIPLPETVEELFVCSPIEDLRPHYFEGMPRLRRLVIAPQLHEIRELGEDLTRAGEPKVVLQKGLFEAAPQLRELTIHQKGITHLQKEAFIGLKQLTTLNLSGNRIYDVERNAFAGLYELRHLNLEHNDLREIDSHVFDPLMFLWRLNLEGNRIERICPRAFSRLNALISVNLAHNRLRFIDSEALQGMSPLCALNLYENPLLEESLTNPDAVSSKAVVALTNRKAKGGLEVRDFSRYPMAS